MSKNKKNRNHHKKLKLKKADRRLIETPAKNIVAMSPKVPLGAYLSEDECKAKMAELNEDVQALMRKHNVFNGIFGCLLPVIAWKESPTVEDPNHKAWKIQNVMAVRVSSATMRQDEVVFLGILNQAAQRLYGPPPVPGQPDLPGMPPAQPPV